MFALRQGSIAEDTLSIPELGELTEALAARGLLERKEGVYQLTLAGTVLNHEIAAVFGSDAMMTKAIGKRDPLELKYACATDPRLLQQFKRVLAKGKIAP